MVKTVPTFTDFGCFEKIPWMISRQAKIPLKTVSWLVFCNFTFCLGRLSSLLNDGLSIFTPKMSYCCARLLFPTYLFIENVYLYMTYGDRLTCLTVTYFTHSIQIFKSGPLILCLPLQTHCYTRVTTFLTFQQHRMNDYNWVTFIFFFNCLKYLFVLIFIHQFTMVTKLW